MLDMNVDVPARTDRTISPTEIRHGPLPNVAITYCTGCRWLLRAAYYAQELMFTFDKEINSLTLIPSRPPVKGGALLVTVSKSPMATSSVVWDRTVEGRFPESKELKQRIRDVISPGKDLGHDDDVLAKTMESLPIEDMDDDEAEEARRYFGVF